MILVSSNHNTRRKVILNRNTRSKGILVSSSYYGLTKLVVVYLTKSAREYRQMFLVTGFDLFMGKLKDTMRCKP